MSYALIIGTEPKPNADISIAQASQATKAFFEIHTIQTNTVEVQDRVVEFEQCWGAALNKNDTMEEIQKQVDAALTVLSKRGAEL